MRFGTNRGFSNFFRILFIQGNPFVLILLAIILFGPNFLLSREINPFSELRNPVVVPNIQERSHQAAPVPLPPPGLGIQKQLDSLHQSHLDLKSRLKTQARRMQDSYDSFRNTSWLSFPSKVFRFAKYLRDLNELGSLRSEFDRTQLAYEEVRARNIPGVQKLFDRIPSKSSLKSKVLLLSESHPSWYARWQILSEARDTIDIQYFYITRDAFGRALLGLLLRKAREGVKIRLMVDGRGDGREKRGLFVSSEGREECADLIDHPNVEIRVFNLRKRALTAFAAGVQQFIASNHDKIIIVDEGLSILGGRNIAAQYYVDFRENPQSLRDTDVLIDGQDIAFELKKAFEEEFFQATSWDVTGEFRGNLKKSGSWKLLLAFETMDRYIKGHSFPDFGKLMVDPKKRIFLSALFREIASNRLMRNFKDFHYGEECLECDVKILDKHSFLGHKDDITDWIIRFIDGSKREIVLQNPFMVMTERMKGALKRAAKRGVRILIHTNSPLSSEHLPTQGIFYRDWKKILEEIPTSRIFTFEKRKLHSKIFLFDGVVSVIGTYNIDYVSERMVSEVVAAIESGDFAKLVRKSILNDISASKEYRIRRDSKGRVEGLYGPADQTGGMTKLKLEIISRLNFLRGYF